MGLRKLVAEFERDWSLFELDRFRERVEALDRLDTYDLDSQPSSADPGHKGVLFRRANALRAELEAINSRLYESIRESIRGGAGREALLRWAPAPEGKSIATWQNTDHGDSYNYLDELVSGVLQLNSPGTTVELSADMVAYQPTPARHIFDWIHRTRLTSDDIVIDLGAGLGHVAILIAILSAAHAVGIELDPSFVECAHKSAEELKLTNVAFRSDDARVADLSSGTVFYLYTPFRGATLRTVLDRLQVAAGMREIRVCTFGPCTPIIAGESWLTIDPIESGSISVFRSPKVRCVRSRSSYFKFSTRYKSER
jgi:Methyltransferase domain